MWECVGVRTLCTACKADVKPRQEIMSNEEVGSVCNSQQTTKRGATCNIIQTSNHMNV